MPSPFGCAVDERDRMRAAPNASRLAGDAKALDAAQQFAELLCVDAAALLAFLQGHWQPGDAGRAVDALQAVRNAHSQRASAARREKAAQRRAASGTVREVIDAKLAANRTWTKKRAFEWLANERHKDPGTISNAYYAPRTD